MTDTIEPVTETVPDKHKRIPPAIGQTVYFYPDHEHAKGMKSNDRERPFVAEVVDVLNDEHVNLVVTDHIGGRFPCQNVPVFFGDDEDDKGALSHCELEAPKPKEAMIEPTTETTYIPPNAPLRPDYQPAA